MSSCLTTFGLASIIAHLPPTLQGFLRGAGKKGALAFERSVEMGTIATYIDVHDTHHDPLFKHAPVWTLIGPLIPELGREDVLVINKAATDPHTPTPIWGDIEVTKIRHVWDAKTTETPENFMRFSTAESIEFVNVEVITTLGEGFLCNCERLQTFDTTPFANVTEVKDNFLLWANALTNINLRSFDKITAIPSGFLSYCELLEGLDMSPLANVTVIGDLFLNLCVGIPQLDFSPLSKVTQVGDSFCEGCEGLAEADLTPMTNLQTIGSNFFAGCLSLKALRLAVSSQLKVIPDGFMYQCGCLEELDAAPFAHVTTIGKRFLGGCKALTSLDVGSLSKVTDIDEGFLEFCDGLAHIDLSKLPQPTQPEKDQYAWLEEEEE